MKIKIIALYLTIFTCIQVTGCTKPELGSIKNKNIIIKTNTNTIATDKEKIDIYIAKNSNKSTDKPAASITDKDTLDKISIILKESDKILGILDVTAPDYVLDIYNFEKGIVTIYLWVGEEGTKGMYMYKERTETGYSISVSNNQKIKHIVTNAKK